MAVLPPRPRGPHLNAMRSFEAAARLGGFASAAAELCVTPGAVSQQVKALEDWVGAPLFERRTQGVALTPLGQAVLADFSAAFDALGGALHRLRSQAPRTTVQIAALPSVAQLWLAPRLGAVRAALPGQPISITAMETPPNLQREVFDLSIFFSQTLGGADQVIGQDRLYPVCSPEVAKRLHTPQDLTQETLIHDATWQDDWRLWATQAGLDPAGLQGGPVHSLYAIAVDDALSGAGVLIGHHPLVAAHIAAGRLVRPFDLVVETSRHLVLSCAHHQGAASQVAALLKDLC